MDQKSGKQLREIEGDVEAKYADLYYKLVDWGKSFTEPFGEFRPEDESLINEKYANVESPKVITPEGAINPFGSINNLDVVLISDTQRSENPNRIRGNVFAFTKAFNFFRILGYKLSELQIKECYNAIVNVPEIYDEALRSLSEKEDLDEMPPALMQFKDTAEFSQSWKSIRNVLAVIKYELSKYPLSRKVLAKNIDEINEKAKRSVSEWFRSGIWDTRGAVSDFAIEQIISQATENLPNDTNLLALDAGDTVATSGTKFDYIHSKGKFMDALSKVTSVARRIFMKGLGNQDSDGREPDVIEQLFKFHGGMSFAQEVEGPDGKKILFAQLNSSFFSSQGFFKVLSSALRNDQFKGKEAKIIEAFDNYLTIQEAVINKINSHDGEIVISVHNPRQFELATKGENPLIMPQGKIIRVVSGHPHKNKEYNIQIGNTSVPVTCFSGYVEINPDSLTLPQGAKISIRNGKTTIERVIPSRSKFQERFGIRFTDKKHPFAL